MRANERARDAIQNEMFSSCLYLEGNGREFGCIDPVGEFGSRANISVRGGFGELVLVRHSE